MLEGSAAVAASCSIARNFGLDRESAPTMHDVSQPSQVINSPQPITVGIGAVGRRQAHGRRSSPSSRSQGVGQARCSSV
jgi:hypothetical protein